jgi:hypothetical protein
MTLSSLKPTKLSYVLTVLCIVDFLSNEIYTLKDPSIEEQRF